MEDRLRSHYESLTRTIRFVRYADTKAAPVLGVQLALLGTLAARLESLQVAFIVNQSSSARVFILLSVVLYLACLSVAIAFAALVYVPVYPRTRRSVVFFEDIASMTYDEFRTRSKELTPDAIEDQLLDQVFRVSRIASVKMGRVTWAFIFTVPTIILWVFILAWSSLQHP